MNKIDLSFVIPAYNEEAFIEKTLRSIDSLMIDGKNLKHEIIVVDDGSRDKTFARAISYAKKNGHVRVIHYPKNTGKGNAVKTGFMHTLGEIVIFIDGDMDINLFTITNYIKALDHADIAIATKWHPQSIVSMSVGRKILSRGFNILFRSLIGLNLKDTQVGLKAMRRRAFEGVFPRLAVKRFAFDVELLTVANLYGVKIVEMPVIMTIDSSFNIREIWQMFVDLLGISYRLRVIRWYQHQLYYKKC
jgi:dolichol-phosphate mannosyltransferase